jgi:hypothetical protein
MSKIDRYSYIFITLVIFSFVILVLTANSLDISYEESINYFNNFNELTILTHISTTLFGQSNITLRLPFIVNYIISIILFYEISKIYIRNKRDQLISVAIFMSLPGVVSAALLVNTSIIVILLVLLYVYIYHKTSKHSYILLILFLAMDNSFAVLFISLFFFALKTKDNKLLVISLVLFGISMQIYGFDTGGKPKGYFIDTIAIYASIFSPLIFFYFIYSLYRTAIKGELDLLWYISTTTLLFSLILSFRQSITIEEFAPFVVIGIPIMVKTFLNSYRVRLPQFRNKHKIGLNIVVSILVLNTSLLIYNKPIYLYLDNPTKHFAYKHHFVKSIADQLHSYDINNINTIDKELEQQLKFYDISPGGSLKLYFCKPQNVYKEIKLSYLNKPISTLYIGK